MSSMCVSSAVVVVMVVPAPAVLLHCLLHPLDATLSALDALVNPRLAAALAASKFERVRQDLEERLEVLLCRFGAAGKRDDQRAGTVFGGRQGNAGDGTGEGSERGDCERRGKHGDDKSGSRTVDERSDGLSQERQYSVARPEWKRSAPLGSSRECQSQFLPK